MARPIPPSLAFYLRHALDNDIFGDLESKPEDVLEEDWEKWSELYALAAQHAITLAAECCQDALTMLASKVDVATEMQATAAARRWGAWVDVTTKGVGPKRFAMTLGTSVKSDTKGAVWVGPYVAMGGGPARVRALAAELARVRVPTAKPNPHWLGDDRLALAFLPLRGNSDLDRIVADSRKVFERLAKGLSQMQMPAS